MNEKRLLLDLVTYQEAIEYQLSMQPKRIAIATYCLGNSNVLMPFNTCKSAIDHVQILVGLPRGIKRDEAAGYDAFTGLFPKIQFRFTRFSHAKCIIFLYQKSNTVAIVGGRNLNLSASEDISYILGPTDSNTLLVAGFNRWWENTESSAKCCWKERLER